MTERLSIEERHESMRGWFAHELHSHMIKKGSIWVVTGDLGYGMFDKIRRDFPERFINVGAAEQAMMGIAVGLALEEKIAIAYSITPFLLYRPFETVRNYLNRDRIPVKMVGGGRDRDYHLDGFSHWAEEDKKVLAILREIECCWPEKNEEIPEILELMLSDPKPWYLNLRK